MYFQLFYNSIMNVKDMIESRYANHIWIKTLYYVLSTCFQFMVILARLAKYVKCLRRGLAFPPPNEFPWPNMNLNLRLLSPS